MFGEHALDEYANGFLHRDIDSERLGPPAGLGNLSCRALGIGAIDVCDHDDRIAPPELKTQCAADAGTGTGDDAYAITELTHRGCRPKAGQMSL